jgi:hypothetical protein
MIRFMQHGSTRSYKWTLAQLETGVKRSVDIVSSQQPRRERGVIGISHSAYEIRERTRVWTAIRKRSGLVVAEQMDLSRAASEDVIANDVRRSGEKILRIVNVYYEKNGESGERQRLAQELNWLKVIRQGGTVHTGDFNAHTKRWDRRSQVQWDATFWEDMIDENCLETGNDGRPTNHWTGAEQEGESIIDLPLATRPLVKWTILANDHTTGSDHEVIESEVGVASEEEADHT